MAPEEVILSQTWKTTSRQREPVFACVRYTVPIYAVLQAGFEFRSGKQENHSTSSVPFSSGRYLPALIHVTELCYEGIRSILTIKSETKSLPGERSV